MKEILYDWGGLNVWLFHTINNVRAGWWDQLMLLGTYLGGHNLFNFYMVLVILFALVIVSRPEQNESIYRARVIRWVSVVAVFALGYWLDGLLLGYLKPMLDFPRPPLALAVESLHVIGTPEYHHSLPSGHSSFAMLVGASLWPVLGKKIRLAVVVYVLWVGVSRISLGMHFPADVLAGYISSFAVVMLAFFTVQGLLRSTVNFKKSG